MLFIERWTVFVQSLPHECLLNLCIMQTGSYNADMTALMQKIDTICQEFRKIPVVPIEFGSITSSGAIRRITCDIHVDEVTPDLLQDLRHFDGVTLTHWDFVFGDIIVRSLLDSFSSNFPGHLSLYALPLDLFCAIATSKSLRKVEVSGIASTSDLHKLRRRIGHCKATLQELTISVQEPLEFIPLAVMAEQSGLPNLRRLNIESPTWEDIAHIVLIFAGTQLKSLVIEGFREELYRNDSNATRTNSLQVLKNLVASINCPVVFCLAGHISTQLSRNLESCATQIQTYGFKLEFDCIAVQIEDPDFSHWYTDVCCLNTLIPSALVRECTVSLRITVDGTPFKPSGRQTVKIFASLKRLLLLVICKSNIIPVKLAYLLNAIVAPELWLLDIVIFGTDCPLDIIDRSLQQIAVSLQCFPSLERVNVRSLSEYAQKHGKSASDTLSYLKETCHEAGITFRDDLQGERYYQ